LAFPEGAIWSQHCCYRWGGGQGGAGGGIGCTLGGGDSQTNTHGSESPSQKVACVCGGARLNPGARGVTLVGVTDSKTQVPRCSSPAKMASDKKAPCRGRECDPSTGPAGLVVCSQPFRCPTRRGQEETLCTLGLVGRHGGDPAPMALTLRGGCALVWARGHRGSRNGTQERGRREHPARGVQDERGLGSGGGGQPPSGVGQDNEPPWGVGAAAPLRGGSKITRPWGWGGSPPPGVGQTTGPRGVRGFGNRQPGGGRRRRGGGAVISRLWG
jgi:hypothetical protein